MIHERGPIPPTRYLHGYLHGERSRVHEREQGLPRRRTRDPPSTPWPAAVSARVAAAPNPSRAPDGRKQIDAFEHKIRNFADLSLNDPPLMPYENVELEDESDNTIKINDVGMKRKGRGPTMCHDVHALEDGKKICVEWDAVGQPVGKGGKSLRTFLRKYDIPNEDLYRSWVMKDLSFKWKFHKYDLRRKYLKQDKQGIQIKPTSRYHINEDMWREAVKVWASSAFRKEKTGTDPDRADVFIITHTRKDGRPINKDCKIAIEKLKALKQTQPSTNSSNPVVVKDDAFSKVLVDEAKRSLFSGQRTSEFHLKDLGECGMIWNTFFLGGRSS
ncbi:hypothetical protein Taro_008758 [Colocasia esculenta]|uniref:Transposase, Ptta/En/Spm, plant n=1 Tax=Colocasia esculenta TaxID=4460 RepID=A0A843U7Z4_COLES|nr:hypothetical protein [Colocasia esculenta]